MLLRGFGLGHHVPPCARQNALPKPVSPSAAKHSRPWREREGEGECAGQRASDVKASWWHYEEIHDPLGEQNRLFKSRSSLLGLQGVRGLNADTSQVAAPGVYLPARDSVPKAMPADESLQCRAVCADGSEPLHAATLTHPLPGIQSSSYPTVTKAGIPTGGDGKSAGIGQLTWSCFFENPNPNICCLEAI